MTLAVGVLAWAGSLMLVYAQVGVAQPRVQVRAGTRIELRTVRRPDIDDPRFDVDGTLRDDQGDPVPGRPVRVRVLGAEPPITGVLVVRDFTTSTLGEFSLPLPRALSVYRVQATFAGDEHYGSVDVTRVVDTQRSDVSLEVQITDQGRIDLDSDAVEFQIEALSEAGGAGLLIQIEDELGNHLAAAEVTDSLGRWSPRLPTSSLGNVGSGRIIVKTEGDSQRGPARTEVPVVRFRATTLTLSAKPVELDEGEETRLVGTLRSSAGPLAQKAVGLFDGEEHIATVLTDEHGAYSEAWKAPGGADDRALSARFESDAPGQPSASASTSVRVNLRSPWRYAWLLLPFLLSFLVLLVVRKRGETDHRRMSLPAPAPTAGLRASRKRSPPTSSISGTVIHWEHAAALSSAWVQLFDEHAESAPTVVPVQDGSFQVEGLLPGRYQLRAGALGFSPVTVAITLPHRGQFQDMSLALISLRARALKSFRALAMRVIPSATWPLKTNRDLGEGPAPLPSRLIDGLDDAYYGPGSPSLSDVEQIEGMVHKAEPPSG